MILKFDYISFLQLREEDLKKKSKYLGFLVVAFEIVYFSTCAYVGIIY